MRFTIDMTPKMHEIVTALATRDGITMAETLRRAIALEKVATEAKARGEQVCLVKGGEIVCRLEGY